jgi:hypothetical protein
MPAHDVPGARSWCALAALTLTLGACGGRGAVAPGTDGACPDGGPIEVRVSNRVDLLAMIDNSSSTRDPQVALLCHFAAFVEALRSAPMGMPDLHLGVATSDMGSGAIAIPSCNVLPPGGDDGRFQSTPRRQLLDCSMIGGTTFDTTGCAAPTGKGYIEYRARGDGNVGAQALEQAFGCIAFLGDQGCGYEAQLASVRRALERGSDATDPANGGFLRDGSLLALLLLTDEDDCSLPADSRLGDTSGGTDFGSPLGPLTSFRCVERGLSCGGARPHRSAGALEDCVPDEDLIAADPLHALVPVRDLVRDLGRLRAPERTVVEVIAGPAPPEGHLGVQIGTSGGQMVPGLDHTCTGGLNGGAADPGVRLQRFLESYEAGRRIASICQPTPRPVLVDFAGRIAARLGPTCLPVEAADPAACTASDGDDETRTFPACSTRPDGPCLRMLARPACPSGRAFELCRAGLDPLGTCRPGGEATPLSSFVVRCPAPDACGQTFSAGRNSI